MPSRGKRFSVNQMPLVLAGTAMVLAFSRICLKASTVEMSGFGSRAFIHRRAAADEIRRIVSEPVEAQEEMKLAA